MLVQPSLKKSKKYYENAVLSYTTNQHIINHSPKDINNVKHLLLSLRKCLDKIKKSFQKKEAMIAENTLVMNILDLQKSPQNQKSQTLDINLHNAILNGNHNICINLLKDDADPNSIVNGNTPLHKATMIDDAQVVIHLLQSGSCPDLEDRNGLKAIDWAQFLNHKEIVEILENHQKGYIIGY